MVEQEVAYDDAHLEHGALDLDERGSYLIVRLLDRCDIAVDLDRLAERSQPGEEYQQQQRSEAHKENRPRSVFHGNGWFHYLRCSCQM